MGYARQILSSASSSTVAGTAVLLALLGCDPETITESSPPTVSITAPADSDTYAERDTITFRASATDAEDNALSGGSVGWTSSLDGELGTDTVLARADLAPGVHVIRVTATDAAGSSASDSVFLTINRLGIGFGREQFVRIDPGTFQMGDLTGGGEEDERPVHTVRITQPFYMQRTETTQAQWSEVTGREPDIHEDYRQATYPMISLSWDEVQEFIDSLNAVSPDRNYRLPTEAEWEYAARAGTSGDFGGTGNVDEMGWHYHNSNVMPHRVGLKAPNDWGLYDMHGNAREWVQDRYDSTYYALSPTDDPQGPDGGSRRILRGGSYESFARTARSAAREPMWPQYWSWAWGFRLVRTP